MLMALAEDKVDFVKLFLSYGVSISRILDQKTLEFLYAYRSSKSTMKYELKAKRYANPTGNTNSLVERFCNDQECYLEEIELNKVIRLLDDICSEFRHGSSLLSDKVIFTFFCTSNGANMICLFLKNVILF